MWRVSSICGAAFLVASAAWAHEAGTSPRLWSRSRTTWIYGAPSLAAAPIGYLRPGVSLDLREPRTLRGGKGCKAGFVGVMPRGFVCLDRTTTLNAEDRFVRAARSLLPAQRGLPFRYALSNGAPMYWRLPAAEEARKAERWFGPAGTHGKLSWGNRAHEELAEPRAIPAEHPVPEFLRDGSVERSADPRLVRRRIPLGSMLAYTKSFEHAGRTWLLAADGSLVPADRVRPFRVSEFAGRLLEGETRLPLAFVRKRGQPWQVSEQRSGLPRFPASDAEVRVVEPVARLPAAIAPGEKWLLVSITRGTLTAYEGSNPVFATLISPGIGGLPRAGTNPVKASTTPLGVYRINFKLRSTTMSPEPEEPRRFWIDEVPHTQYFAAPFALHGAYWHEDFGSPKSAGCINLSPRDAAWLFDWTEPRVPEAWSGAVAGGALGKGTLIVIRR